MVPLEFNMAPGNLDRTVRHFTATCIISCTLVKYHIKSNNYILYDLCKPIMAFGHMTSVTRSVIHQFWIITQL